MDEVQVQFKSQQTDRQTDSQSVSQSVSQYILILSPLWESWPYFNL